VIGALLRRYWLQLIVVALIGVLAFFVNHYRDNAITYKDQRDKATARAETSEAITSNVITTMNLIRDISQATQNAKNELAKKDETRIVYIRQALEGDPCANQLVPAAAADSLREYADSLRSGPGGADKR
jgi:prophage endopeptidase